MSDLLTGWYVDSSPGGGISTSLKCGYLVPSTGIVGTSEITTSTPEVNVDTLGGRSTNNPDTDIPAGSTPATRTDLYLTMGDVVFFDGHSAVYGIPKHANSGSFSMSFWYNPYEDEFSDLVTSGQYGVVYGNSGVAIDSNGLDKIFHANYTSHPYDTVIGASVPSLHYPDVTYPSSVGYSLRVSTSSVTGFTTDPDDDMQGWCHVMLGMHTVSGVPKLTIYVNDTAIVSDYTVPTNAFHDPGTGPVPYFDETFVLPFNTGDFTDPAGDWGDPGGITNAPWTVGGLSDPSHPRTLPSDGDGLQGAITELWIAPGQYLDWSSSAVRKKFHTSDLVGQHYAPVDLGSGGQRPTGTKPHVYCTGNPSQFPINRATGRNLRVYRNSIGGFVGMLLDYLKPPQ